MSSLFINPSSERRRVEALKENPSALQELAEIIDVDLVTIRRVLGSSGEPGEFDDIPLGVIGRIMDGLNAYCGDGFFLDFHASTRRAFRKQTGLEATHEPRKKAPTAARTPLTVEEEVEEIKGQIRELERKTGLRLKGSPAQARFHEKETSAA